MSFELKDRVYRWVIALCCTLITIINGGVFFSFSVFFKPVASEFGWSRGEFSVSYTAMLVAYASSAFLAGRLADKHGPRPVLLVAAALIGLGFISCSKATNLTFMALSYASIGLGLSATLALPTATVQRWFSKWRAALVGIVVAGTGIGGFIFAPLANYLIEWGGWQVAYMIIGIVDGVVIAISAAFLLPKPKLAQSGPAGQSLNYDGGIKRGYVTLKQAFRSGTFWAIASVYILTNMPDFFIKSHLVPYVTDKGIASTIGAESLGMIAGAMVVGRVVMSWIAGKIGWMKSLAFACFVASLSTLGLLFVKEPSALFLFALIYGFSWGSTLALLGGAVGHFFGLSALSELLGFLLGLTVLLGAVAPFLGGISFDLTGSYLIAICFSVLFFALAGLLSALLHWQKK